MFFPTSISTFFSIQLLKQIWCWCISCLCVRCWSHVICYLLDVGVGYSILRRIHCALLYFIFTNIILLVFLMTVILYFCTLFFVSNKLFNLLEKKTKNTQPLNDEIHENCKYWRTCVMKKVMYENSRRNCLPFFFSFICLVGKKLFSMYVHVHM